MAEAALNIDDNQTDGQTPPQQPPQPVGQDQPLPPEQRTKLDGIVVHMYQQKASKEEIQAVVNDFKAKYSSPQEVSDNQKTVNDSQNTIKTAFNDKQVDNFLNKTSEDNLYKSLYGTNQQSTSESQPVPKPDIKILPSDLKAQRDTFKDVVDPNSQTGRTVLESSKDNSKDPNFNNKINAAFYANDRGVNHNPEIHQKIASGQLGYDLLQKRPTKDVGAGQAFINGWKQHSDAVNKADYLTTTPADQIIADEEKKRADNQANVDVPIPKYNGWAKTSNMLGENAIPIAEGTVAAGTVGLADYLTGGAAHPLLAPALGGFFMARDAGKSGASEEFDEQYNNLRDQGVDPRTAYSTAIDKAKVAGALSAAQMAVMSAVGFKSGAKPLSSGFKNAIKQSAENFAPELAKQLPVMGGFKALENINSGKPWDQDITSSVAGGAAFMTIIHGVATLPQLFTPKGLNTAMNGLANANPEFTEAAINQLHNQGSLTPEQTQKFKDDITAQRELNKGLPENVPEENKQKIKDLIDKRTSLENQLDPEHPDFVDKAYHPDIKQQINGVKKEKADGTTEGKDGINEKIRQLSEPVKSNPDEPLLKSPMDQAKEIISERSNNGMLGDYPSDDPEELLKHIAEQAHGGSMLDDKFISTKQPAEDAFGKDLTDLAVKIHPEHIIQEPKSEPQAATGEPAYLLSRHADTVKDEQGKVSGPNEHPLSPHGRKDANDLANEVEQHIKDTGVPVTKIVHSSLERAKETGDKVAAKTDAKTVSDKGLDTWDIGQFDDVNDTDFKKVQKYFVEHPDETEYEGKKLGETFNQYAHRTIDAHAKYENEPASTMLVDHSNNMMIMDAYRKNGNVWDDKAAHDYLNSEKPEPATLVNNKNKQNAIPEQTTDEVRLRDKTAVGAEMGGRNTEPQSTTDKSGQPNVNASAEEKSTTQKEEGDGDVSGIKNDISRPVRAQRNLPEVEFPKMGSDTDVLNEGKKLVDSGKIDPRALVDRINSDPKSTFTPDEAKAMQYYMRQLKTLDTNLRQELASATDEDHRIDVRGQLGQLDDETDAATAANLKGGNDWAQLGNIRQIVVDEGFNASRQKAAIKDAYGGSIPKDAQARMDAAFKERDAALEEKNNLEEQLKQKEAELNTAKMKKAAERFQRDVKRTQTKEQLKAEEKNLVTELKKALKRDLGQAHAGIPIPVGTVEALGKLAINYLKQGVNDLGGIVDKIHDNIKDEIDGISKQDIRDLIARYKPLETEAYMKDVTKLETKATNLEKKVGTPTPKREKLLFEKDTRWIKANQRVVDAEYKIKQEKNKAYNSKQNWFQKTLGFANHLFRLSILSGKTVLAKLSAQATIGSLASREPESFMNQVWSMALPKIGEKADIEGYYNAKANAKFYSEFFNGKKFAENTASILASGSSMLTKERENQIFEHIPVMDLPTDLHTIIKDPPKRAAYEWALEHILTGLEKKGIDINNPLVLEGAKDRAFARAKYEIFLEDNSVSRKFAEWQAQDRAGGNIGAMKNFLLHFIFPVSKVPTNIARRIGAYAVGVPKGLYQAREAFSKGIDNLSPDEANQIVRLLSKGSIGWSLFGIGLYGAHAAFGGVYNKEVNEKKGKMDVGELGANKMKVGNNEVPEAVQHAVPLQVVQLGATYRIIHDHYKKSGAGELESNFKAAVGSTASVLSNIPVVGTPIHLAGALFNEPGERKRFEEDMKRRVEPQILRETGVIKPEPKATKKSDNLSQ